MTRKVLLVIVALLLLVATTTVGYLVAWYRLSETGLQSAFITDESVSERLLAEYTFPALRERTYAAQNITIESELADSTEEVHSYLFSSQLLGRNMTGQLLLPAEITSETPVIVMLRGYVPLSIYETGVGTRNAARAFARAGFITIAPDFFGYGESDPEPEDSWQGRFEKPAAVAELLTTIEEVGIPTNPDNTSFAKHRTEKIGIWGHSNGGQIALSTKVITSSPAPTTLWAPVTAPFPYSVLYFSDETEDEGRGVRLWINQLDSEYDLREFSHTQYLDGLTGPLQIHHGTNDDAALKYWSDEFIDKIEAEDERRADARVAREAELATSSATMTTEPLPDPDVRYFIYPGADHNLQPPENWSLAVTRDITFFRETLDFPASSVLDAEEE